MRNKQYFFKGISKLFTILLVVLFNYNAFGAYPNCAIDIDKVSDNDVEKTAGTEPGKLFIVIKKNEFEANNWCYNNTNYVECDKDRLDQTSGNCTNKIGCSNAGYKVICDSAGKCECKDIKNNSISGGEAIASQTCTDFNNYFDQEKNSQNISKACYPKNHICLNYKNYFNGDGIKLYGRDISGDEKKFYVYKKNIIKENNGNNKKNCEFYFFSCDYKIVKNQDEKNLLSSFNNLEYYNLVSSETKNTNNLKFIENIFAGLGDNTFFAYAGKCDISNGISSNTICDGFCETLDKETSDNPDRTCYLSEILKKKYYYKYYNKKDKKFYYYEKNISEQNANGIGELCNQYLPNCSTLRPNNSKTVLYDNLQNSNNNNNRGARSAFYGNKTNINEAYLLFANSSTGDGNVLCLSRANGEDINYTDEDIGYCSDIDEDGNLKYKKGLEIVYFDSSIEKENDVSNKPNCYIKSCIDVIPDEFKAITEQGDKTKKYCSEYYYLSNTKGLKYFAKEEPLYCSDLAERDDFSTYLKFAEGDYENDTCTEFKINSEGVPECSKTEKFKYDFGGGINREKGNCYIKNCYSLTKEERKLVSNARINNIALELERACEYDGNCNYEKYFDINNLPVYCDNGFLFNKETPGYTKFDPVNLNVIPCYAFSSEQLSKMSNDSERVVLFTDLIGKDGEHRLSKNEAYDTNSSIAFCRTHYIPLNLITRASDNNENSSFFNTRIILANEKTKANNNSTYISKLNSWGYTNYENMEIESEEGFGIKYFHDDMGYKKLDMSSTKLDDFPKVSNYLNILKFVDNIFPYYNADIPSMQIDNIYNGNLKINNLMDSIKSKNNDFYKCRQEAKDISGIEKDEYCIACVGEDNQDKCLWDKMKEEESEGDDYPCRRYATKDYECRLNHCDNQTDSVIKNYCYIEDYIKNKIVDETFYIATKNTKASISYLDCSVYMYAFDANNNTDNASASNVSKYKEIANDIISDFMEETKEGNKTKLELIASACRELLPIDDDRELPLAESLNQMLKPYKTDSDKINFHKSGFILSTPYIGTIRVITESPGKHDLERYGCTNFSDPGSNYGAYGCKLPDVATSFFNERIEPNTLYDNKKLPTKDNSVSFSLCSRYQKDVHDDSGGCGQREGASYTDKCLPFVLGISDRGEEMLDNKNSKEWIFSDSTGGTRIRTFREHRDIYAIRDFATYHNCTATEYYHGTDSVSTGIVYGEGLLVAAPICIPSCSGSLLFFSICTPICTAAGAGVYLGARQNRWKLDLQNDLYIIRGYNEEDGYRNKGFISHALLTDNNNYIYRFYSRQDNIEEDLKNKLESNNGYFHRTSLGVDILKTCGINTKAEALDIEGDSSTQKYPKDEGDYSFGLISINRSEKDDDLGTSLSYKIKKFKEDGTVDTEDCIENDLMSCLSKKQIKCIKGFGVNFFSDLLFNIDKDFILRLDRNFLMRYHFGDTTKDNWGTAKNANHDWLPVDVAYDTIDTQTDEELANNPNCKMGLFNDPIGDLSRCRGFSLDCKSDSKGYESKICKELKSMGVNVAETQTFFTESQSLKIPLPGHPFFFYTLITPKNTPEIFDPSIFVKQFCNHDIKVSDCYGKNMTNVDSGKEVVLNFYEPNLRLDYDYNGGTLNSDYTNYYQNDNNFISTIESIENNQENNNNFDYSYSCPYLLRYKSNMITVERQYLYVLHKTFEIGIHNEYTPQVCVYRINETEPDDQNNKTYDFYSSDSKKNCSSQDGTYNGSSFIITDNNVMCFPRAPIKIDKDELVLAQSPNINYNRPYINVKIVNKENEANPVNYYLRQNEENIDIDSFGENKDIGFGLNFTRSYCSKLYYDYYDYLDKLENGEVKEQEEINRIKKSISSIESYIKVDCNKENGYETEFLINESEIKSKLDDNSLSDDKVVFKETTVVKKNNYAYGGFYEVCVSEYDIDNIFNTNEKYKISDTITEFSEVLAFIDDSGDGVETKCLLDMNSRSKKECMNTDRFVYMYLTDAEKETCSMEDCPEYIDVNSGKRERLIKYECIDENGVINNELTKSAISIDESLARKIAACYKGGFNTKGIVHKSIDSEEKAVQCSCTISDAKHDDKVFKTRKMTSREYGLCVDLKKPIICPAVRYYDETGTYIDDNLALGKTKEEMDKNGQEKYYEQHLWRTNEKMVGHIPSVFYTTTLGHAEFPSSVFCENIEDCVGNKKDITGTCLGYWKTNNTDPIATCTRKTIKYEEKGITKEKEVYEYVLKPGTGCIRYTCPGINSKAYPKEVQLYKDEYETIKKGNAYTKQENTSFDNIKRTDYRSFINNEEIDLASTDKRGLSHGFATWLETESDDFAINVYFASCLTGYGIAGANYKIYNILRDTNGSIKNKISISLYQSYNNSIVNNNNVTNENRVALYNIFEPFIGDSDLVSFGSVLDIPTRYCNQKGEWMEVNDVYTNKIIDIESDSNNLYHSGVQHLWLTLFNEERKDPKTITQVTEGEDEKLIDKVSRYGYCERIVCREIKQMDLNYYYNEFLNNNSGDVLHDVYKDANGTNKYDDNIDNKKFWLHSGGADWSVLSSPRNSTSKILVDEKSGLSEGELSSRNVNNVFDTLADNFDDFKINNRYKYIKKTQGYCKREYGYYNRGSNLGKITTPTEQVNSITFEVAERGLEKVSCPKDYEFCMEKCQRVNNTEDECKRRCNESIYGSEREVLVLKTNDDGEPIDENNNVLTPDQSDKYIYDSKKVVEKGIYYDENDKEVKNCIDSRLAFNLIDESENKPYRVCTNTGAWGEISDKCTRSCELLHLFKTNVDRGLVSGDNPINTNNPELKVENNYIKSFVALDNITNERSYMEGKFYEYNLRDPILKDTEGETKGFTRGDYIFGGADWPRSIVNVEQATNYECKDGKCLRYIEVQGICNGDYDTEDVNNPTQYANSAEDEKGNPILPTRKCYEDGTWGPITNRCVLKKKCTTLNLYAPDLAMLISEYNREGTSLIYLNKTLNKIYSLHNNGDSTHNHKNDQVLISITDTNTTKDSLISCNSLLTSDGFSTAFTIPEGGTKICAEANCCNKYANVSKDSTVMVCNISEDLGNYTSGWSFDVFRLEKYIIPRTCTLSLKEDIGEYNDKTHYKIYSVNNVFSGSNQNSINDIQSKADRLSFNFVNEVNNNTQYKYPLKQNDTDPEAKHYVLSSNFDLVFNSINKTTTENYKVIEVGEDGEVIDAGIGNISANVVNINGLGKEYEVNGQKYTDGTNNVYYPAQIYGTCDNRYFYNEVDNNNYYYNRYAIFTCNSTTNGEKFLILKDNDFSVTSIDPSHKKWYLTESDNSSPASLCKPKTCGGEDNPMQRKWSISYVKEYIDEKNKRYDVLLNEEKESKLGCEKGYAFVVKDNIEDIKSENVEYFNDEKSNIEYYKYGFIQNLKATCTANRSMIAYSDTNDPATVWNDESKEYFKKVNNEYASNPYQANKYGDLETELPLTFCKDIAKTNCTTFELGNIIHNENGTFQEKLDKNGNGPGYCVRMGCPRNNLIVVSMIIKDIDNNDVPVFKATQPTLKETGETIKPIEEVPFGFTLPFKNSNATTTASADDYYDFGDVVVINSLAGDFVFENSNCPEGICGRTGENIAKKFVRYTDNNSATTDQIKDINGNDIGNGTALCPKGWDIYTSGADEYTFYGYLNELYPAYANPENNDQKNKNETREKVIKCFDDLYTKDSISRNSVDDNYVQVATTDKEVYVRYNNIEVDKRNVINSLSSIKNYDINDKDTMYSIKNKTKQFIKDNTYGKIKIPDSGIYKENPKMLKVFQNLDLSNRIKNAAGQAIAVKLNDSNSNGDCSTTNTPNKEITESILTNNKKSYKKYNSVEGCCDNGAVVKVREDGDNVYYFCYNNLEKANRDVAKKELEKITNEINKALDSITDNPDGYNNAKYNILKDAYKKYYNFYKIENYFTMEDNVCRINNYNKFLSYFTNSRGQIFIEDDSGRLFDLETGADGNSASCESVKLSDKKTYRLTFASSITKTDVRPKEEDVNETGKDENAGTEQITVETGELIVFNDAAFSDSGGYIKREYDDNGTAINNNINENFDGFELAREDYETYFVNIFASATGLNCLELLDSCKATSHASCSDGNSSCSNCCNVRGTLNFYTKFYKKGSNGEFCDQKYSEFLTKKDAAGKEGGLRSGLYMVMQCTPEGWIIQGKNGVSCKPRCNTLNYEQVQQKLNTCFGQSLICYSQTKEPYVIGKNHADISSLSGNYDVYPDIQSLRYSKDINLKFSTSFQSTCVTGPAMRACKYEYNIVNTGEEGNFENNNGTCKIEKITATCGKNQAHEFDSHYKASKVCRRCQATPRFNGEEKEIMYWGSVDGISDYCQTTKTRMYLPCPSGVMKNTGGNGGEETCSSNYDTITTIKYKTVR